MSFERSIVVFAILFCFVQNKFVFCKAIVGFYFGIVKDDILLLSFSEKQYVFDCIVSLWMEVFKEMNCELCRLSFLYRELRRFSNNALQRL